MLFTLDYQPAVQQRAGIGRYTKILAQHLPRFLGDGDRLRLFYFDFMRNAEAPAPAQGLEPRPFRLLPGAILQQLWKRNLPPHFDMLAGKADLYHFCNFTIPPVSASAKVVVSIHDMSFMRHPECAEKKNLAYLQARLGASIKRADAIITISRFSAREIAAFFPEAKGKIHPIYLGVDQSLASPGRDAIVETRGRYGLDRPYILSVGTVEPRKNFAFLADVFDKIKEDVDLVIAGHLGWNYEPTLAKFKAAQKSARIKLLTDVGDADLAAIYAGAELYATTSIYEGFGFTPLEAMLCGTPVIASTGGAMEEVLQDSAFMLRKFDPSYWASAIDMLLSDRRLRGDYRRRGFACAQKFRWEETARQTAALYHEILGK